MSNSLDSLELIARTAGVTAALILAMSLARSPGASVVGRLCGALLCCGVAAYLPCSMRPGLCAAPALLPVVLLASGVPFFFWAWTSAIMDDDFRLRPLAGRRRRHSSACRSPCARSVSTAATTGV
jgi:hypothetical protein